MLDHGTAQPGVFLCGVWMSMWMHEFYPTSFHSPKNYRLINCSLYIALWDGCVFAQCVYVNLWWAGDLYRVDPTSWPKSAEDRYYWTHPVSCGNCITMFILTHIHPILMTHHSNEVCVLVTLWLCCSGLFHTCFKTHIAMCRKTGCNSSTAALCLWQVGCSLHKHH